MNWLRNKQQSRNAIAVAFIILALAGAYALYAVVENDADNLYNSQIQSCERGNKLRGENNRRLKSHYAEKTVLRDFLSAARKARLKTGSPTDKAAATQYSLLIRKLDRDVSYGKISLVNCSQAIPKP